MSLTKLILATSKYIMKSALLYIPAGLVATALSIAIASTFVTLLLWTLIPLLAWFCFMCFIVGSLLLLALPCICGAACAIGSFGASAVSAVACVDMVFGLPADIDDQIASAGLLVSHGGLALGIYVIDCVIP